MKPEPEPGPVVEFYRCSKGHEQFGEQSWQMSNGEEHFDTGPLCRRCLFDWFTLTFGTQRQAPPTPVAPPGPPKKKGRRKAK